MGVCVVGSINLDTVQRVERLPHAGETVLGRGTARFLGGKGANQSVASARAGAPTRLLGAVGADPDGEDLLSRLAAEGVDVSRVRAKTDAGTGSAYICVAADGENLIVVAPGANGALRFDDLDLDGLEGCAVLLAQLKTPVEVLDALLWSAETAGVVKILNAAPARLEAESLFVRVDMLVVNETELAAFAGKGRPPASASGCIQAARQLLSSGPPTVIVTRGAAGALAVSLDGVIEAGGLVVDAVDATGAGDCFCGVLAASLAEGAPLPRAMARANLAASLSVTRPGASASMPRRDEIEAAETARSED